MDFWRTVAILSRHKWLILLSAIVAAALMWGSTRLVGSHWRAAVEFVSPLRINGGMPDTTTADSDSLLDPGSQAQMYGSIVKSRDVVEPVLQKFNQTSVPTSFFQSIDFTAVGPKLFELSVTDTSPERAGDMANSLADQFLDVYHNLRTKQAHDEVLTLQKQLVTANTGLITAREKYESYRTEHEIVGNVNLRIEAAVGRLQSARGKEDGIRNNLADAQARLAAQEQSLAQLPAMDPLVKVSATGELSRLQDQYYSADQTLKELQLRFTEKNPQVQKARQRRDMTKTQYDAYLAANGKAEAEMHATPYAALTAQIRQSKQDIAAYQGQQQALQQTLQQAEADLRSFKGVDTTLNIIASDVAANGANYANVSGRLNVARQALDNVERQNPIIIFNRVNSFNPPVNTSQGRTMKLTLMAAIAAMLCTSALLVALNSVDRRLKTVNEANIELPARILAAIPQPHGDITYANLARVTELQPQSLHSEAYRFLGLHLLTAQTTKPKAIMILAAKAEQGSTTTLTNLGITLAQAGKRVILVDANMRTAEIHTVFGVNNEFGFTDVLRNPADESFERALQQTSQPNLQFITSGSAVDNPWILFRSKNLNEVSRKLHEQADYVLYDTPSSLMFTDALNLAPIVDAAILCVRALEPLTGTEDRLVEMLEQADVAVMGSVLTDVPTSVMDGFRNYQHYYQPSGIEANGSNGSVAAPSAVGLLERPASEDSKNGHRSDHRN